MPSTNTSWSLSRASTLLIPSFESILCNSHSKALRKLPGSLWIDSEISLTQSSQVIGTANVVCSAVSKTAGIFCGRALGEPDLEGLDHGGGRSSVT